MTLYNIYTSIVARLKAKVPAIKKYELWNNQTTDENWAKQNNQIYPCVFVEWSPVTYTNGSNGVQNAKLEVTVHVISKAFDSKEEQAYLLDEEVVLALHNYNDEFYEPLIRVTSTPDQNYGTMKDFTTVFQTGFLDTSTHVDNNLIDVPAKPALVMDLVIDEPQFIRTGKRVKID
jgi:hypothetical protein